MPIYEYECQGCGHEFEREQRITDAPIKTCPACRTRKVRRLISRTSFVLKGGGWYSDLYASGKSDKKSDKETKSDGGESRDSGGPSEKKEKKKDGKSESEAKSSSKSPSESTSKSGSGGKGSKAAA